MKQRTRNGRSGNSHLATSTFWRAFESTSYVSFNRPSQNYSKMQISNRKPAEVIIMVMGPTGTGKSTFVRLLTNDNDIQIGHSLKSQTSDVKASRYIDAETTVTLVDTLASTTRMRVLLTQTSSEKSPNSCRKTEDEGPMNEPENVWGALRRQNTLQHSIRDHELERVEPEVGREREGELAEDVFKPFIDGGAKLLRHDKERDSAQLIVSELICQTPVVTKLQEELAEGKALGDTSAGAVIVEEMKELQKKHRQDMEDLKKEIEQAARTGDEELKVELAEDRRRLEEVMMRVEEDRKALQALHAEMTEDINPNRSLELAPAEENRGKRPNLLSQLADAAWFNKRDPGILGTTYSYSMI
ncbi:hypothetical protein CPB84DRAFT_1959430 [Gymnopilus junonius]|uniref:G domain-containing protein n=1 Tax=Gymnopilus junonius TaxID=109634 RepID=A0A9P5NXI2_GYMJU|nr:hypothetical protein CPB84DRAFT_1959430 [Gymnopilus junonius]